MIRFDIKNSVKKTIFMKAMQYSSLSGQIENLFDTKQDGDQHLILSALKEIEQSNEKTAVGLVNALFLSSTSHALDKVCLNIFSRLGDGQSLRLLYKKYPTPESVSISLLPYYIRAIGFLGASDEFELLAKLTRTFWGLYRKDIISAFEQIGRNADPVEVSDMVASALVGLYEAGDEVEKQQIVDLTSPMSNDLLLSVYLSAVESENSYLRRSALARLAGSDRPAARRALELSLRRECDESLLDEHEAWLIA
jgi:hypothetical protein